MAIIQVGARREATTAEGPGTRYALWTQGCSLRCRGCCNPHLFDPAGGESVEVGVLLQEVSATAARIEGVSILGGEPFEQPHGLAPFVQGVRELGLGVIIFTGFTLEQLRERPEQAVAAVLAATDLLVDGRYDSQQPETQRPWVGSLNQRFHYLTTRYSSAIENSPDGRSLQRVELRIDADGRVERNGWPL